MKSKQTNKQFKASNEDYLRGNGAEMEFSHDGVNGESQPGIS
jgi:hypothetical protein